MKKLFVMIALSGAVSSLIIIGGSRMSMELDKRIPISIAICAALLLLILAVFGRRADQAGSVGFALIGLFLAGTSLFVVNYHWRPRSQTNLIMKDLQQLPPAEKQAP